MENFRKTLSKEARPGKERGIKSALSAVNVKRTGSAVKQAFVSEKPGVPLRDWGAS